MRSIKASTFGPRFTAIVFLILTASIFTMAQKNKTRYISATAMGTSTQMGRIINIDVLVSDFSTDADKSALIEAFTSSGSEGLANALDKMSSKGRIRITGTLGYDVNYIRIFSLPDGSRLIRFVTDRPITFGENWGATRSRDYEITIGEIVVSKEKGKSQGKLFPAARVRLNKQNEIEVEAFQNPWNLQNIRVSN
ncbi:MAG: hypothetical protein ACJ72Z_13210 [Pyrinomonadaceae bacterium]